MPFLCRPWAHTLLFATFALPALAQTPEPPAGQVVVAEPHAAAQPADTLPQTPIADADRSAIAITSLALDLHLSPADSREEVRATLTLRNATDAALARLPLQLSSTLHWLSASAATPNGLRAVAFSQSPIANDADHTGYAQEAVFTPAEPLAPGASLTLVVVYAGEIKPSADRLELIGAPHDRAIQSDWDAILPTSDAAATALRGFGNVLWYPVAAPAARFGDGNRLFDLIARERRRNVEIPIRLRLTVEYVGDPPDSAIFNGQLLPLSHAPDTDDQLIDATRGIATADFPIGPIGLRTPSLFLTAQHAVTTPDQLVTAITPNAGVLKPYAEAAQRVDQVLTTVLGPTPRAPLLVLDHPGETFEDAGLLVAPLNPTTAPNVIASMLIRGLAHTRLSPPTRAIPAAAEWIGQGLAEYLTLDWTVRNEGREAAIGKLRQASVLLALAESTQTSGPQPLPTAYADAFLRLKSAFVFWQLHDLLGDALFNKSLTAYRHSIAVNPQFDREPTAFQKSIEKTSERDLAWFFNDWVYADRGLPDLTIVSANPRTMPAKGGKSGGFLVAVEVRNDGDAVADVPVTVRSGTLTATERLRIAAHASAATRIVFEGSPETVQVNDGSVPELRTTSHVFNFNP